MRDLILSEALKRLAAEAATCFSTLVASGDQIPFDVAEQEGPDSLFHSYVPLTARYVREREHEVSALPTFGDARHAVEASDVAAGYLESRGEPVAADARERATRMLTVFLAELWDGCTEFSLDRARLDSGLTMLDAEMRGADEAEVIIAPLIGLRMSVARLKLPRGVEIIRADAIDVPVDAVHSEGMGRTAWEPQFLAVAEQGEGSESAEAAMRQLRELVSVLRLFKGGGIGLGPYAFAPTGDGQWRRLATGATVDRAGGYRLSEEETTRLADFARRLEEGPDPKGRLAWALGRFEMGCERESALEGLSDHLLALRGLLEGQGPVGASLPMRAAALIAADSSERIDANERIEQAMGLESSLMTGARVDGSLELAMWIEESVRGLVREAALGELGTDLGTAADETLIATGLEAGDASIVGTTSEWETPETMGEVEGTVAYEHDEHDEQDTHILEPIPGEGEISIRATNWMDEVEKGQHTLEWPASSEDFERRRRDERPRRDERIAGRATTGEAGADEHPRMRIDTPRVRHLFEVPEDAEWEVRELNYDHYNRRAS